MELNQIIDKAEQIISETNDHYSVINLYENWLKQNPNHEMRAYIHFNLGVSQNSVGESSNAIKQYEYAVKINPKFWQAILNLGNLYEAKGNHSLAIELYEKARFLDLGEDGKAKVLNHLGLLYENERNFV